MRRHLRIPALILAAAMLVTGEAAAQTADWKQIPIPPLTAFHPQQPKRVELPNGMIIFLQEDHELPLIDGVARIRGGSRSEPASKTGMLDLYGEVWRTGGTTSQTGDQLDDYLEIRAAKVETSSSADATTISWSCLKGDNDDVFKVFVDLLREPEFRADKLELAQREEDDSISRRNDDVGEIAARESSKLAYGKDNPYTREPEYATVAAVTRQDLIDWHHTHVYPNNIILGIVGDFDSTAMEAKLRQTFSEWKKGPVVKEPEISFTPAKPGYYLVSKEDVNQSNIRMVELGIRRDNPDYYATQVFNEVFGGGFSSRLVQSIRTARGLAYSVGGGIGSAFDHPGIVRLAMGTKSSSTIEAIRALDEEIDKLKTDPINDDEIKRAKDSILNSFVFNFDSPEKVLRERMAYEFYGYPADFLERFRAGIEKTQTSDVARVAAKYLHKDQLAVLVVGKPSDFDKPLSTLGAVTNIDITIPPPPVEKQEATVSTPTASNAEGKALAARVVDSMGGLAKLKSVKSLQADLTEKESESGPATPLHVTIVFPDRMHVDVQTPQGQISIVVTPDAGFMSAGSLGTQNLPEAQKHESLQQIRRDMIYIGQHLDDSAFVFSAAGTEKIGELETHILDIRSGDMAIRWFVDPESGHVVRETYQAIGRTGPFHGQTDLSDWKTNDGITLPAMHRNKEDGSDSSVVEFTRVQFNPPIDAKLFQEPASESKSVQ